MLLAVDEVWKSYPAEGGRVEVLRGASLSMQAGQTVALTGGSGSGKATVMHPSGGRDAPDKGRIVRDGADVATLGGAGRARLRREKTGVVFQQFNLIPSLDAGRNIAFQARLAGAHDPAWCAELADRLGLSDHLHHYPEQLSGGQQQRVAIGRALAARPALVLADEPTGNLDESTGDAVMDLMLGLVADTGAALLMVTHSGRLAARLGRRLRLQAGQVA